MPSMQKNKKIVIVGAGPIGCYLGQLLKHYGFKSLMLEEHQEIGQPIQCAGIVGKDVFEKFRLPISRNSIINTIDGARMSFNGDSFNLNRPGVAFIINRALFDKNLSQGLEIELGVKVESVNKIKDGYILKTNQGEYFADVVIGADGPNSRVRKSLGFVADMKLYSGYQYVIKHTLKVQNLVDVCYSKPFSLFSWVIPEGNGLIRVGIISDKPYQDLNKYVKDKGFTGEIIEKNAGAIPIGICELVKGNAALLGDAACQIKPITSGGIFYGMKAAEFLADAIKEDNLSSYSEKWQKEFEQEVRLGLLTRSIMENLDNRVRHRVFNYVKSNSTLIEKVADFENHSSVFWTLVSNPRTYRTIASVFFGLIKNPKFLFKSFTRSFK